jgi:hypothetical protein
MRLPLAVALVCGTAALARPARSIPALSRTPRLQGAARELSPAVSLKAKAFTARVAYRRTTLYVGIEAKRDVVDPKDLFEVSLHFPEAGVSAPGYVFRLDAQGKVFAPEAEQAATPQFVDTQVKAAATESRRGFSAELAIPVSAFPRFPLKEPLILELCVTFQDSDGGATTSTSNCKQGEMSQPLRLPEEVRGALGLHPPEDVTSLEPGDGGWLGYGVLFYPLWVQASEPIDSPALRRLMPTEAIDPKAVGVGLPRRLDLPGGGELLSVLSGKNPYEQAGKCDADEELRLGLFLVHGKSAERVLDFPAANCALGRATSVVLDEEGALTISYSNGATTHFRWTGDKFEQTQIG